MISSVKITGKELGSYQSIDELRKKARAYAEKHVKGVYTVQSNGDSIIVGKGGIKHATTTHNANKIKAIVAIPKLIEQSQLIKIEADKKGRDSIKSVRKYAANLCDEKQTYPIVIVVRETKDGKLFYDHYIEKKPVSSQGSDEQLAYEPITGYPKESISQKGGDVNSGNSMILLLIGIAAALLQE